MVNITTYRLELVKEKTGRYDCNKTINQPKDAYNLIESVYKLSSYAEECLVLMTLNTKNQVTGLFVVSLGTINASLIHPREIFKRALLNNANSIIMVHNHPSGDLTPSQEDIGVTKRLKECGELLGVSLLDHIIVSSEGYKSLIEYVDR